MLYRISLGLAIIFVVEADGVLKNILVLTGQDDGRNVYLSRKEDGGIQVHYEGNVPLGLPFQQFGQVTDLCMGIDGSHQLKLTMPDLIVNVICNGDTNQRALQEAVGLIKTLGKPVINHPKHVLRTGRQSIAELSADIDSLMVPPVLTIKPRRLKEIEALWSTGAIPHDFLIRPLAQHGGKSLLRVTSAEELAELEQFAFDGQAFGLSPFINYQSQDGYYRKYRLIFVDGVAHPRHMIIHADWMVHSNSRSALMNGQKALQAEEQRFLDNPKRVLGDAAWAGLHELVRRTELDFVGVDFGLLPDGRALLFECNACMNALAQGAGGGFTYLAPVVERIRHSLTMLVQKRLNGR